MTLTNIPASILGKVLLELVSHGLMFQATYDTTTETFNITLTGGF
jgi:predicted transcriptional regulator